MTPAKVRFAPSPTGFLHVGNCRTALINWLCAKKLKGTFLLRLDDTDLERSRAEYADAIHADLKWLGIVPDELVRQSDRHNIYREAVEKLKQSGRLYPCYETTEELDAKRATQLRLGHPPLYDRAALTLSDEERAALEAKGRRPHWRLKLTAETIQWHDLVRGLVSFESQHLSDPVLVREDGSPVYTLASVVDDISLGVTHIIRGEDHVANTVVQIQLMQALGADVSQLHFAHLPLLADEKGQSLSKRLGSTGIEDLRKAGILPMAVNNLLARIGTSQTVETYTSLTPLIGAFDFKYFARSTPKFSMDALEALNEKLLHQMSFAAVREYLEGLPPVTEAFWDRVHQNISSLQDLAAWWHICTGDVPVQCAPEDRLFIELCLAHLPATFGETPWHDWTTALKPLTDRKGKTFFMPIRLALTGQTHGPELPQLVALMGREQVEHRLQKALT